MFAKDSFGSDFHRVSSLNLAVEHMHNKAEPWYAEGLLCSRERILSLMIMLQTRELVEMVRKVRFNKIDSGLQMLQGPMTVKLNNLSAMELNTIRPFFAGALNQFWKLAKVSGLLVFLDKLDVTAQLSI